MIAWALAVGHAAVLVTMVTAVIHPVGGVKTHYGFQPRGPMFVESKYCHLLVDVDLTSFGEAVKLAEKMISTMGLYMATNALYLGSDFQHMKEMYDLVSARAKAMNMTYTQLRMYYTAVMDEENPEDVEVRAKRFIFTALLGGALGGLMGGGLYGYISGGQTAQFREQLDSMEFRMSKLVHVAEMADKSIHVLDDDLSRLKQMSNKLADAVVKNTVKLGLLEFATKMEAVVGTASSRMSMVEMVAAMASANRVSHGLLPYEETKREFAKLGQMAEAVNQKLVTTDVRKLVSMEATLLPGKNNRFSVMVHVPTYREDLVLEVWRYESYALYDEENHVNLRVKGENEYLAVAKDGKFFTELSAHVLASCHVIGQWRMCPDVTQLREDSNSSCLMSLFLGQQKQAMRICQLQVEPVVINVDPVGGGHFRVTSSKAHENMRITFTCIGNKTMMSQQMLAETYVKLEPGCTGIAGPVRFFSETTETVIKKQRNLDWTWSLQLKNESLFSSAIDTRKEISLKEEWKDRKLPSSAETLMSLKSAEPHWSGLSAFVMSLLSFALVSGVTALAMYVWYKPRPQP